MDHNGRYLMVPCLTSNFQHGFNMGVHMPRTTRSAAMDSPTKRKALEAGGYHQEPLLAGGYLRYRCPALDRAGAWFAQARNPDTGKLAQVRLAEADDRRLADGREVMDYRQAREAAEAAVKAADQRVHELTGEAFHSGPYTVADAWADYLEDAKRRGVKGVIIYDTVAKAKILPVLGAIEVDKLTRKRVEDWHLGVAESPRHTGKKDRELKPDEKPEPPKVLDDDEKRARRDTANRDLSILKAALNFALQRGKVIGSAPWRIVKPFAGTASSRVRILTKDEQDKLIAACDPDFRTLVLAALYTGGRYGELCKVRVEDFNGKTLLIKWGKSKAAAKPRHAFLTDEAIAWFTELVKGRGPSELMFQRKDAVRTTRGDALKDFDGWAAYDQVHALAKACKAAGIETINFHQLRHTHASNLLSAGVAGAYVSKQLGHVDSRMVSRHYGHLTDVDMAVAIRKNGPSLTLSSRNHSPDDDAKE